MIFQTVRAAVLMTIIKSVIVAFASIKGTTLCSVHTWKELQAAPDIFLKRQNQISKRQIVKRRRYPFCIHFLVRYYHEPILWKIVNIKRTLFIWSLASPTDVCTFVCRLLIPGFWSSLYAESKWLTGKMKETISS